MYIQQAGSLTNPECTRTTQELKMPTSKKCHHAGQIQGMTFNKIFVTFTQTSYLHMYV